MSTTFERPCVVRVGCGGKSNLHVAGEFNRWRMPGPAMRQTHDGIWEAKLPQTVDVKQVVVSTVTDGQVRGVKPDYIEVRTMRAESQSPLAAQQGAAGPSEDAVRLRAYQIYLDEGRPDHRALIHWLMAERELAAGDAPVIAKSTAQRRNDSETHDRASTKTSGHVRSVRRRGALKRNSDAITELAQKE